jgi:hypothetical protein
MCFAAVFVSACFMQLTSHDISPSVLTDINLLKNLHVFAYNSDLSKVSKTRRPAPVAPLFVYDWRFHFNYAGTIQ